MRRCFAAGLIFSAIGEQVPAGRFVPGFLGFPEEAQSLASSLDPNYFLHYLEFRRLVFAKGFL